MKNVADIRNLIDRLRGRYTVPVNDGGGLLNGSDTFTQVFQTSSISHEAANTIESLSIALADIVDAELSTSACELRAIACDALGLKVTQEPTQ